jgi:hypothetical protein
MIEIGASNVYAFGEYGSGFWPSNGVAQSVSMVIQVNGRVDLHEVLCAVAARPAGVCFPRRSPPRPNHGASTH